MRKEFRLYNNKASIAGRTPQAKFYVDAIDGKCKVVVVRSSNAPKGKKISETIIVNRYNKGLHGYIYEVTPEEGNNFYKLLKNQGWETKEP